VKIVGFQRGQTVWPPASNTRHELRRRKLSGMADYPRAAAWLRRELMGSRVVVSKPRMTSLGLTLLAGVRPSQMLLDNDDWELGFKLSKPATLRRLPNLLATLLLESTAASVPNTLASNSWLGSRFGCPVLPHVRDTAWLDPAAETSAATRLELGMEGRVWVGFIGSVKPHKGVEDLVAALAKVADVGLFLAGVDESDPFASQLLESAKAQLGADRVRVVGFFDFGELRRWLSVPDVICIPSRSGTSSWGQIPAKLFDAMAMAKPVIVTAVNDMPDIVAGVGCVVPPGDVEALAAAIGSLASDEQRRRALGEGARARAIASYSYSSASGVLQHALSEIPSFV
jgi:glycosyltransferase involved in cell wall biosynthesis